jgi:hypothetical protein
MASSTRTPLWAGRGGSRPQRGTGRFSRTQRPISSPTRRVVAGGRSFGRDAAARPHGSSFVRTAARQGTGRRFGRRTPQPTALDRAVGSVMQTMRGGAGRHTRRSPVHGRGKPAALGLVAAAGLAMAGRRTFAGKRRHGAPIP